MTDRPLSLRQKVCGPNAKPIAALIARGDRASIRAQAQFGNFLATGLNDLRRAADALSRESGDAIRRQRLLFIVRDLRTASTTAGRLRLGAVLASLENAAHMNALDAEILGLHLDAAMLASNPGLPERDYQRLSADLARAVAHRGARA